MSTDTATRSARARFQSGLLAWLRQPGDPSGLREMVAVLREQARNDPDSGRAMVWRSAEAFLVSLLDGRLAVDDGARQLCRRIERQLTALARGEAGDDQLNAALFAYLSGRAGVMPENGDASASDDAPRVPALDLASLQQAMGNSLARTAEILPLIAGAVKPRHPAGPVAAWLAATRELDAAWQDCLRRRRDDCRPQATALVAAALTLNTPACLQFAESLAHACAVAEDAAARDQPGLRAAIAAALEIAGDRDGPNHTHFDQRAGAAARRLDTAAAEFG